MKPLNNKIKLDIKDEVIGGIQSDSISEKGIVLDVGPLCSLEMRKLIGKTLYFKAWAIDVITVGDDKHYFISEDSDAICGYSEANN